MVANDERKSGGLPSRQPVRATSSARLVGGRFPHGALALTALLLALILLWRDAAAVPPAAWAQVPNAGAQRYELLDELRRTNALLARVVARLEEGPIDVRMVDAPASRTAREEQR